MKFTEFLHELSIEGYRKDLDEEQALNLIRTHCKNADPDNYIVRGARMKGSYHLLEGQKGGRVSVSDGNYYTLCIDHMLEKTDKSYPLRSKSIICSNSKGRFTSEEFGDIFAIFPYDDTVCGIVNYADIWRSKVRTTEGKILTTQFNDICRKCKLTDSTYSELVMEIKDIIERVDKNKEESRLSSLFDDDVDSIEKFMELMFDPTRMEFTFGSAEDANRLNNPSEVWIGGPCVAIRETVWENIKNKL